MRIAGTRVQAGVIAVILGGAALGAAAGGAGRGVRVERREWAAARMDEMANERLRCRDRFPKRRDVERCEVEYARRFRQYNEIYLEASRE